MPSTPVLEMLDVGTRWTHTLPNPSVLFARRVSAALYGSARGMLPQGKYEEVTE
jgi:hypothetical protein